VTQRFLSHADLGALVAAHRRVIAPVRAKDDARQTDYLPIRALADAALGAALPRRSLKEFFLPPPRCCSLTGRPKRAWRSRKSPLSAAASGSVRLALRCRGAGSGGQGDGLGVSRRTVVWTPRGNHHRGPAVFEHGFQLLLQGDRTRSRFAARFGRAADAGGRRLSGASDYAQGRGAAGALRRDGSERRCRGPGGNGAATGTGEGREQRARHSDEFAAWLEENFDHPAWKTMALRCHGCGACAGVCPTCHCFDIVDEHDSSDEGCAAATGTPARRQSSRSRLPDTIPGRARASASGSGFSTSFPSIPNGLARYYAPAAAAVAEFAPAA